MKKGLEVVLVGEVRKDQNFLFLYSRGYFGSLPRLSGHGPHGSCRSHVHRSGRPLPRIQYYEPILVSVS